MPYILLILGLLIGGFALLRFFSKASVEQIKLFFRICLLIVYGFVLLYFAMTGRIVIAIGIFVLSLPILLSYYRK